MYRLYPRIAATLILVACATSGTPNVDTALIERLYRSPVSSFECDGSRCTYMVARGELVVDVRESAGADWAAIAAGGSMLSGSHEQHMDGEDLMVRQSGGDLLYVRRGARYVVVDMRAAPHNARSDGPLLAEDALHRRGSR